MIKVSFVVISLNQSLLLAGSRCNENNEIILKNCSGHPIFFLIQNNSRLILKLQETELELSEYKGPKKKGLEPLV